MSDGKVTRTVVITNPQGLHARPADLFVKTAQRYDSKIEIVKENLRVDGKSILDLLMLAAVEGTSLLIEASGGDADQAIAALCKLVEQNFSEELDNDH